MRKRALLAALAVIVAAVPVAPPSVSGDDEEEDRVVVTQRMQLTSFDPDTGSGTQEGTFTAAGALNDAGTATATFTMKADRGCGRVFTGQQTLTTMTGTITLSTTAVTCPFPPPGLPRFYEKGKWLITGGTGAYATLHGRGTIVSTVDFTNGQITIAREGFVHFRRR